MQWLFLQTRSHHGQESFLQKISSGYRGLVSSSLTSNFLQIRQSNSCATDVFPRLTSGTKFKTKEANTFLTGTILFPRFPLTPLVHNWVTFVRSQVHFSFEISNVTNDCGWKDLRCIFIGKGKPSFTFEFCRSMTKWNEKGNACTRRIIINKKQNIKFVCTQTVKCSFFAGVNQSSEKAKL